MTEKFMSGIAVLTIIISNPDLAGIHQKVKEIVPWLQVCAATRRRSKVRATKCNEKSRYICQPHLGG